MRHRTQTTTIRGYDRLIERLGDDFASAAESFERLRRRLVRLLAWQGTSDPEALADETLERVARQLGSGLEIRAEDPFRYAARVAQLVAHEDRRAVRRQQDVHQSAQAEAPMVETALYADLGDADTGDARLAILEWCLEALPDADRELILTFYRGEKGTRIAGRRALAERHGISINALRIRAYRLRQRLEDCVRVRLDEGGHEMKAPSPTTHSVGASS